MPRARAVAVANRVEEVAEQQLDNGVVGIAVAVVAGDGVLWSGAFGRLDIDRPQPVATGTVFPIQSVSKSIVATALMRHVELGAIRLDDPVNEHLGSVAVANEWEERSPVTIRQLLTHTAGLPMTTGRPPGASLEDQVAQHVRTEAEPGTRMIYANWGYDVLGYLLGVLHGSGWQQAVRDSVLLPLGMRATTPDSPTATADLERPTGHGVSQLDGSHLRLGLSPQQLHDAPAPSGGLVSTVEDLARFLIAHLNGGGGVVAPEHIADMHRLHAPLGAGGGGMGLGFRVDVRGARPFFCHAGDGMGFTTFIGGHPQEQVGVVVLMNTGGAQEARSVIARRALDSVLGDAPRVANARKAGGPPAGGYRSTYWGMTARVDDSDGVPVVKSPPNALAYEESTGGLTREGHRWRVDGGMFDGCELDFETTAGGGPRFYGGLYPLEFIADDAVNVITLPVEVDETGTLDGAWGGTTDTPLGPIPLELEVDTARHHVTITVMGTAGSDPDAETQRGWIRAQFDLDIAGFGALTAFARLGLVAGRFEGLLYIRTDDGEFTFPTLLSRA